MITASILRLEVLCNTIPALLLEIDDASFSAKQSSEKWSIKEILGHLIDSATNNHQRFVRAQYEKIPVIIYDQNKWNKYSYYQQIDQLQLVSFWTSYNKQLLALIREIPQNMLQKQVCTDGDTTVSLAFLINDYVVHLEHHLHQVVRY